MKKPVNRAISPSAPYGELAPTWGTSCRPIPKTTAQTMNRNVNRNFAFGFVTLADPAGAALGRERGLEHDPDHQDDDGASQMPNGMGCWKATRNSCIVPGC